MHVRFVLFPASIALAVLLAGCNRATPAAADTRAADATAIRQLETDWLKAYQAKDADKITSFYADDAAVFNPGMSVSHRQRRHSLLVPKRSGGQELLRHFPSFRQGRRLKIR